MIRNYGGVVWTNHALDRLEERKIKQGDAFYTFRHPQQSRYAQSQGAWVYYRDYDNERIEVVAKQNEKKEWIILSVWSRTIIPSHAKPQKKQNFLFRIFKSLLKNI